MKKNLITFFLKTEESPIETGPSDLYISKLTTNLKKNTINERNYNPKRIMQE